jgi:hypothetical protein
MPGAGDLDLLPAVEVPLRRNAAAFEAITAGLDAIRDAALARDPAGFAALPPAEALEVVEENATVHPALMPTLARAVAMTYYQQPAVLLALGEPARPPFPEGFELEPISAEWSALLQGRAQPGKTTAVEA